MQYRIIGQTVPVVEMKLTQGETVYTQSGGFAYSDDNVTMVTDTHGGILNGIGRLFSGESLFVVNYTAQRDDTLIAFSSTVPGGIVPLDISNYPNGFILQKGAFLCAQSSVSTQVAFSRKLGAGLFGGEGFILQKATGNGLLFLEVDGDIIEKDLAADEVLKVDTGNVVAFEPSVSYDIETVKGFKNIILGGEGLFLTKLTGPGKVYLQSESLRDFANRLIPFLPTRTVHSGD